MKRKNNLAFKVIILVIKSTAFACFSEKMYSSGVFLLQKMALHAFFLIENNI